MDISQVLAQKVQEQIGGLTFELLKKESENELLKEENAQLKAALQKLTPEKKEEK